MAYGLHVSNIYGSVQIDSNLPPLALVQTGVGGATALSNDRLTTGSVGAINYARQYLNPIIFIRSSLGNEFAIVGQSPTGFEYVARGAIEYRIYEGGPIYFPGTGYGLVIYNEAGQPVFDSSKQYPLLNQITQCWNPSPLSGGTGVGQSVYETAWASYYFSLTAFDGGLPFISAQTFTYSTFINGPSGSSASCLECKFVSTGELQIAARYVLRVGSFVQPGAYWHVGQQSRKFYLTR